MTRQKKITELPPATTISGLYTIGVDGQNRSVKVPMALLKGKDGLQPVLTSNVDERGHLIIEVKYETL